MSDNPRILVGIPCFNCEKQVVRVISSLKLYSKKLKFDVVFVDNGSTDNTVPEIFEKMSGTMINFELLQNKVNRGYGGSMKVIYTYSMFQKYDYLIILHGDDQASLDDVDCDWHRKSNSDTQVWLGARFMKGSLRIGYSEIRTFGNKAFNILTSLIYRKRVFDLGSGLNIYKCSVFSDGFYLRAPNDLTFDYFNLITLLQKNVGLCFFPISWKEIDQRSNVKIISQTFNLLKIILFHRENPADFLTYEELMNFTRLTSADKTQ